MKIGTRASKMALAQTDAVIDQLKYNFPDLNFSIEKIVPLGDSDQRSKLGIHGGKGGAFVAAIRKNLIDKNINIAMHSLKDIPGNEETPGTVIAAYLRRDDPTDSLVLKSTHNFEDFRSNCGAGYKIGTNSVRRAAILRSLFPFVEVLHFRGAADTRIRKLENGELQDLPDPPGGRVGPVDGLVMATSGISRIGMAPSISYKFPTDQMLPAAGQGIVAVECAVDDWDTRRILSSINDLKSEMEALAEREVLWILDGHCNSPIAVHSVVHGSEMILSAMITNLTGDHSVRAEMTGDALKPRELGRKVAEDLIRLGAKSIIENTRE